MARPDDHHVGRLNHDQSYQQQSGGGFFVIPVVAVSGLVHRHAHVPRRCCALWFMPLCTRLQINVSVRNRTVRYLSTASTTHNKQPGTTCRRSSDFRKLRCSFPSCIFGIYFRYTPVQYSTQKSTSMTAESSQSRMGYTPKLFKMRISINEIPELGVIPP